MWHYFNYFPLSLWAESRPGNNPALKFPRLCFFLLFFIVSKRVDDDLFQQKKDT